MTLRIRPVGLVLMLVLWALSAVASQAVDGTAQIARLHETSRELSKLAREALPARLPPDEQREALAQRRWLEQASHRCDDLAERWERALAPGAGRRTTQELQEMNASFNRQLMQLQSELQHQARQFTLASNILKVKSDTAKAAIENIR
jgi:hypothetical protein